MSITTENISIPKLQEINQAKRQMLAFDIMLRRSEAHGPTLAGRIIIQVEKERESSYSM